MIYTIDQIKEIVQKYAKYYKVERVYLFGSYANGSATENSDIDLRIDKGRIRGIQIGGLLEDLKDAFGKNVDLIPTSSLDKEFLENISKEEVLIYDCDQN